MIAFFEAERRGTRGAEGVLSTYDSLNLLTGGSAGGCSLSLSLPPPLWRTGDGRGRLRASPAAAFSAQLLEFVVLDIRQAFSVIVCGKAGFGEDYSPDGSRTIR